MRPKEISRLEWLEATKQLLDHMGSTELAANLFRAAQTEEKLRRDKVKEKAQATLRSITLAANGLHEMVEVMGLEPIQSRDRRGIN